MRRLIWKYAVRGAFLWLVLRCVLAVLNFSFLAVFPDVLPAAGAGPPASSPGRAVTAAIAIAAVATFLVLLDVRAMRERVFLANLGVSLTTIAAIAFLTAVTLEATTRLLLP